MKFLACLPYARSLATVGEVVNDRLRYDRLRVCVPTPGACRQEYFALLTLCYAWVSVESDMINGVSAQVYPWSSYENLRPLRTNILVQFEMIELSVGFLLAFLPMFTVVLSTIFSLRSWLRSRAFLQVEILALRHQLTVLKRPQRGRLRLNSTERLLWVWLARCWANWRSTLIFVKPETVIAWH